VHATLHGVFPRDGHLERAKDAIERAIRGVQAPGVRASLWAGFTGVVWALEHVQGRDAGGEENAVDRVLPAIVAGWKGPFDLMEGLCGFAVYALERPPAPSARAVLDAVVARFAATAERSAPGVTWRSRAEWVPPSYRRAESSQCDLGVAHGTPGVMSVLARVAASSSASARTRRKARSLLDAAVAWELAQELPADAVGRFARACEPRDPSAPREPARLAWCRGDAGIAAALAVVAQCTGDRARLGDALRIGLAAAARPFERSGVRDPNLCHGAAGVGHALHRVYRATGDERIAEAARRWLLRALAMPPGPGVGLLTGRGGVLLALLAATGDADSSWDRAFAISATETG
jgi:hypothetical protein